MNNYEKIHLPFKEDGTLDNKKITHAFLKYGDNKQLIFYVVGIDKAQSEPLHWGKLKIIHDMLGYTIYLAGSLKPIFPKTIKEKEQYDNGWTFEDEKNYHQNINK